MNRNSTARLEVRRLKSWPEGRLSLPGPFVFVFRLSIQMLGSYLNEATSASFHIPAISFINPNIEPYRVKVTECMVEGPRFDFR